MEFKDKRTVKKLIRKHGVAKRTVFASIAISLILMSVYVHSYVPGYIYSLNLTRQKDIETMLPTMISRGSSSSPDLVYAGSAATISGLWKFTQNINVENITVNDSILEFFSSACPSDQAITRVYANGTYLCADASFNETYGNHTTNTSNPHDVTLDQAYDAGSAIHVDDNNINFNLSDGKGFSITDSENVIDDLFISEAGNEWVIDAEKNDLDTTSLVLATGFERHIVMGPNSTAGNYYGIDIGAYSTSQINITGFLVGNGSKLTELSHTLDEAYDSESGTRTIYVDDGDIFLELPNSADFALNLTADATFPSRFTVYRNKYTQGGGQWSNKLFEIVGASNQRSDTVSSVTWIPWIDNSSDLGSSNFRWKDLYLAGTIKGTGSGETIFMNATQGNVRFANQTFNVTQDGLSTSGYINISGAGIYYGNGSGLTGLTESQITDLTHTTDTDTQKEGTIPWLYNDTTTMSWNESQGNKTYLVQGNESLLDVNSSVWWDNVSDYNETQLESDNGILSILESWLTSFFNTLFGTKTTDDLTEGSTNLYDNQSWNQSHADALYPDTNCSASGSCTSVAYMGYENTGNFSITGNYTGDTGEFSRLGIGTAPSSDKGIQIAGTPDMTGLDEFRGISLGITFSPTAASQEGYGTYSAISMSGNINASKNIGLFSNPQISSTAYTGLVNELIGILSQPLLIIDGKANYTYGLKIEDMPSGEIDTYSIHTGAGKNLLGDDTNITGNLVVENHINATKNITTADSFVLRNISTSTFYWNGSCTRIENFQTGGYIAVC